MGERGGDQRGGRIHARLRLGRRRQVGRPSGFAEDTNGLKFGFVSNSTTGFIRALETMGETKVLACPRLLVLNKQRAEIHLGKQLGYQTSTVSQTSTTQTVQFLERRHAIAAPAVRLLRRHGPHGDSPRTQHRG